MKDLALQTQEPAAETVVYASYVSPFPAHSGERIRALNLIAALRHLGYCVEAFVGNYDRVDLSSHSAPGLRYQQIPFAWPRLRQSASIYFKSHALFVRQIAELHRSRPVRAIILDYGFMGAQIRPLSRLGIPVILGTHNAEAALTGQVRKPSLGATLAIWARQMIETAHERRFFPLADAVICVSEQDRDIHAKFIAAERLHVVPNFTHIADRFAAAQRTGRIIMSGSFDNFQNREGLRWFLDRVWDDELAGKSQLCVAGRGSDAAVADLGSPRGVVALGVCDDLLAEIARSGCAIVPLLQGSGTRLKCLEAMAVRTPVVTTSKGCEGIAHGGAFRVADTPQAFKAAILEICSDPDRAERQAAEARAIFDRLYSLSANAAPLNQVLIHAAQIRRLGFAAR